MTHTPGPWYSEIVVEPLNPQYVRNYGGHVVAQVYAPFDGFETRSCNSALISAVPDLLSACEAMLHACGGSENWNGETHDALKLMEAAIAKARGE